MSFFSFKLNENREFESKPRESFRLLLLFRENELVREMEKPSERFDYLLFSVGESKSNRESETRLITCCFSVFSRKTREREKEKTGAASLFCFRVSLTHILLTRVGRIRVPSDPTRS